MFFSCGLSFADSLAIEEDPDSPQPSEQDVEALIANDNYNSEDADEFNTVLVVAFYHFDEHLSVHHAHVIKEVGGRAA